MTPSSAEATLLDGCCLVYMTGSRLYGCADPSSDRDLRGIVAPTRMDYIELTRPKEHTVSDGMDVQTWSLHHWCDMFAKGSPNALEIALLPDPAILHEDNLGRLLRDTARNGLHAGFIPHLMHYAHGQHHQYERGEQPGKRLMHAVRVMRLAFELADNGRAGLEDPDTKQLLRIRHGAYVEGETEYRRLEERLKQAEPTRLLPAQASDGWDKDLKMLALKAALDATPEKQSNGVKEKNDRQPTGCDKTRRLYIAP